jgi:hypothetical protein
MDGRHAEALAGLAQAHVSDILSRWSPDPDAQLNLADAAALNGSVGLNPLSPALAYLAAAHAWNGDKGQARSALYEFRRMRPCETLRTFGERLLADHQVIPGSRLFEGLRMAGLPE